MELKGLIELGDNQSITCCTSIQDYKIGGQSLYSALQELFSLDASEFFEDWDGEKKSPLISVKYVILDEVPKEEKSFNDLTAEVVTGFLYADHFSGCYSEYTCGYGGFDYLINEHSIFNEMRSYSGKYIHLLITEENGTT